MPAEELRPGDKAQDFSLASESGRQVSLSELKGKTVVLYFYPKDDTPGCTKEACGFESSLAQFSKKGVTILGVSADNTASHQRFAKKYNLTFPLLSDLDFSVCKAYGVYKEKSLYGKTYWGIERTTFLIDESGRISSIFPKVKVDGHIEAVLSAVKAMAASR